jgi:alpha/beta superfamily hydrolase
MTIIPFPTIETTLHLPGPAGTLETLITPKHPNKIAVICHPHPLQGGTMQNKVVTTAAKAFLQQGISTIRFNYRGVGASTGTYGDFIGETEDLLSIIDWAQQQIPDLQLWLAGFSFGAYISAQGALQRASITQQLFSIAPAVNHNNFNDFTGLRCPWVVIQGETDEVVPPEDVYHWVAHMEKFTSIQLIKMPETSHFFHGKLVELRDILVTEIKP